MKKMLFTLVSMLTIAAAANAMPYEQARREALFLTDKMAYELNLSDAQYEAAYEINLDYLMSVTSQHNVFGPYWDRRNLDLSYILYQWQWDAFRAATYFYRPLYWEAGLWHFGIYIRYPHRDYFYFGRPHFFATYRGGHSWHHNGGRSWYEGRHSHFRPAASRDHHVGMRNHWDRGDYRHNNHNNGGIRDHGTNGRNIGTNHDRGTNDRNIGTNHDRGTNERSIGTNHDRGTNERSMSGNSSYGGNRSNSGNWRSNSGSNATPNRSIGSNTHSNSRSMSSSSHSNSRSMSSSSHSNSRSMSSGSHGNSRSGGGRR